MMWLLLESADPAASVDALFGMISPFLAILLRKKVYIALFHKDLSISIITPEKVNLET